MSAGFSVATMMRMRLLLLAFSLIAAPAAAAETRAEQVAGLEAIRAADLRIATVGERLAVANVALCTRTRYRTGLLLHDVAQYAGSMREAAREAFRFDRPVMVEAVVAGGPAERAGLTADTALLSIEGQPLEAVPPVEGQGAFARMAALLDLIDAGAEDGVLRIGTLKDGKPVPVEIRGEKGCASRFQLVFEGGGVNAGADGHYVQVEGRMIDFVGSDAELAAVLAHELAHNILDHRARLNAAGVDRGMLGVLGKSGAMIRATEVEADRLSVYVMANAGYDPQAAVGFWDRLGARHGFGIFSDATHLRRKPRVALFRRELDALDQLRGRTPPGTPLIPDFARRPFAALR